MFALLSGYYANTDVTRFDRDLDAKVIGGAAVRSIKQRTGRVQHIADPCIGLIHPFVHRQDRQPCQMVHIVGITRLQPELPVRTPVVRHVPGCESGPLREPLTLNRQMLFRGMNSCSTDG